MKRILLLTILLCLASALNPLVATPQPSPAEKAAWDVTLKAGSQASSHIDITNQCKQAHTFNVAKQPDMQYFQYALEAPIRIPGHQSYKLPVQFTAAGVPAGQYHGNVAVICLDCRAEPTCAQDRENLGVHLSVVSENPENEPEGRINVRPGEVTPQPPQNPGKEVQQPKENEPEEYFLPTGMQQLVRANALKWYYSPFPPPGVNWWWWNCCCCCEKTTPAPQPAPSAGAAKPSAPSSPPISVSVNLDVGKFGQGKAIHILYVVAPAQYLAEAYIQWKASGGTGQLTVDLDVQRPGSSSWTKLVSGMGPDDEHLYNTSTPGTYVFRATAKDSTGKTSFNTLTVTFPRI